MEQIIRFYLLAQIFDQYEETLSEFAQKEGVLFAHLNEALLSKTLQFVQVTDTSFTNRYVYAAYKPTI